MLFLSDVSVEAVNESTQTVGVVSMIAVISFIFVGISNGFLAKVGERLYQKVIKCFSSTPKEKNVPEPEPMITPEPVPVKQPKALPPDHYPTKLPIAVDERYFLKDTEKTFVENLASGNILDKNEPYSTILPKLELADGFLTEWRKRNPEKTELVANACHELGYHYNERAMYRKAVVWTQSAVEIREKVVPGSLSLATSYNNVGLTYSALGDPAKALEYQEKALEIRQKALPADHPSLATSYNNVGYTYGELGDHAKELEYKEKALEIRKKVLPAD
ncbi:MAG: tetratricopeptide repeat protein, partial [Oscillospiraceae bacterium]|nr:tetratricopeptide repeat protein [Oscillospiraceae bacterium]